MSFSKNSVRRMDFTISLRPQSVDPTGLTHGEEGRPLFIAVPHPVDDTVQHVERFLNMTVDGWVFQVENSKPGEDYIQQNVHIQGRLIVKRRMRTRMMFDKMCRYFEEQKYEHITPFNIRITPTSNPTRNFSYVMKEETRVQGPFSDRDAGVYVVQDPLENKTLYTWQDLVCNTWLSKQGQMCYNKSGRKILFVIDKQGCTGKSSLVKHLMLNRQKDVLVLPPCGSASQLSKALVECGPYPNYVLDLPRVKPSDEKAFEDLLFIIEQLSNGIVTSVMYGQYKSMIMDNPAIVILSNYELPYRLSADRYVTIDPRECRPDSIEWAIEKEDYDRPPF